MTAAAQTEPRAPYDVNPVLSLDPQHNGKNLYGEKETVNTMSYTCIVDGKIKEPIKLVWWMGRSRNASRVYCTIWLGHGEIHAAGHGWAGGWGYHKESAAAHEAMNSAGVKLTKPFDGCGTRSIEVAVLAIAEHLGLPTNGKFI